MIMDALIGIIDALLLPLSIFKSHIVIFIIAASLTLVANSLNKLFLRKMKFKDIKERIALLREKINQAEKHNKPEEMKKVFDEFMKVNKEFLRISLLATFISLPIVLIFFPWFSARFSGKVVAVLPFSLPFIGNSLNWIIWYILVSLAVSWLLKSFFGD